MIQPYDLPLEQLQNYKPELTRQPDFDAFWTETLKELAAVPLKYELVPYDYPVKGVKVYNVTYTSFNNATINGWLAVPDTPGKHPGMVLFHGYNWAFEGNIHDTVNMALRGYVTFQMLVRGQQGTSMDNVIYSGGSVTGWMTRGILSPYEYYYRAVYADTVRALEMLASFDGVDAGRIGVMGGSQGGALTLVAAALSDIPKVAVSDYPYLSNFNRAIDITPDGPYGELNEYFRRNSNPEIERKAKLTLSYFDVMNLAPRIKCHTLITMGLVDEITPPSTVFAAYNHLSCSKEIAVFRYFGHENMPGAVENKLRTLMKYLEE